MNIKMFLLCSSLWESQVLQEVRNVLQHYVSERGSRKVNCFAKSS